MRGGKKDSYMGDVGIIKKIDDLPLLKEKLIEAFDEISSSHKAISEYSLLLAHHILDLTQCPITEEIQAAIDINLKWQAGLVRFQEARNAAFECHRAAREEKDPVKVKVLRIMAQVAATPHVKRHALIASDYAVTLINLMYPKDMDAVKDERETQITLMKSVSIH